MTSPIEWLMDREILRQFPQRYARAVDQRDHDALTALFDPDGSVDGTFGQQAVADYLDTMGSRPDTGGTSMHVLADPLIDLEVGADTARLDTYAVVYQVPADADAPVRTFGMRYVDDMLRREGTWCIHHRVARMLWMRWPERQRERTRRPGRAPVASPSRMVTSPPTTVARNPSACCDRRLPPRGRSRTTSGTAGPTRSGSNTFTSATIPSRNRPRSVKPHAIAGASVSMRTASSSVNSCRSRTQYPSRWVWIDASAIWLRCAPESENVITVRGMAHDRQQHVGVLRVQARLDEQLPEVGLEREIDHRLHRRDAPLRGDVVDRRVRREPVLVDADAVEVGLARHRADPPPA